MNLFRWLIGSEDASVRHTVTVTPAAAAAVRRIASEQRLDLRRLCLLVGRGSQGQFALDLSEDETPRNSRRNAVATSNGTLVVIPRASIQEFADLVIDFEHGGFRFRGSVAPETLASDPGRIELSRQALLALSPTLINDGDAIDRIAWHLRDGDSRAAVVVSVTPLVIAAYTDELDAVALLKFPDRIVAARSPKVGDRLLAVNMYEYGSDTASDLTRGESDLRRYRNFTPIVAEFVAADPQRVAIRKAEISAAEWNRAAMLGEQALVKARGRYRNGCPPESGSPAF